MEDNKGDHFHDYYPDLTPQDTDPWNRNPSPPSLYPDDSSEATGRKAFVKRIRREAAEHEEDLEF